jgi:hypothetical protein
VSCECQRFFVAGRMPGDFFTGTRFRVAFLKTTRHFSSFTLAGILRNHVSWGLCGLWLKYSRRLLPPRGTNHASNGLSTIIQKCNHPHGIESNSKAIFSKRGIQVHRGSSDALPGSVAFLVNVWARP